MPKPADDDVVEDDDRVEVSRDAVQLTKRHSDGAAGPGTAGHEDKRGRPRVGL